MAKQESGLRLPGVEPGTLLPANGTCDSSPSWSEVTHFYDILIISSKNNSDLTQITHTRMHAAPPFVNLLAPSRADFELRFPP